MPVAHPLFVAVLLFIVVFVILFIAIFSILQWRQKKKNEEPEEDDESGADDSSRSPTIPAPQTPASHPTTAAKYCLKCGAKIPSISDYCPSC
jgi:flagellar biosynthesis/type III secretory pathway M-ring protein FliF/YscJ